MNFIKSFKMTKVLIVFNIFFLFQTSIFECRPDDTTQSDPSTPAIEMKTIIDNQNLSNIKFSFKVKEAGDYVFRF